MIFINKLLLLFKIKKKLLLLLLLLNNELFLLFCLIFREKVTAQRIGWKVHQPMSPVVHEN